ncbi:MAG TPA: tyrosine--tRNA ligase [Phycisphaerae bacterium]|nr:tyrosine--tRNA ligase [Phycisphaerae bacterium]HUT61602.1 tyrosine--tRNA ligase [Phycisphaerae bacterium]
MGQISQQELESQTSLLARGCEAIYTAQELRARLEQAAAEGRQLRIKLGLDPTAPDIHLGHTVVLRKMRQFQDLGHRAVLIIGDYTARVGDPSGQDKTRPVLSEDEISTNAETYFQQAGKVLDTSPEKLEIRRNSEWLQTLGSADVLRLSAQMTVAQMLERDTFEKRYKAGVPIGVHEFLYPILQGYDSVMIRADVELGGSDQTFNNLVGRDLQRSDGQPPQIVVIMPILVGLDGVEKMSKSKGNYIGVTDTPGEMFGKVMSIPDTLMDNYFTLLTDLPREQIDTWVNPDRTHPRDAKVQLGRTVVAQYHGKQAAEAAAEEFDRVFARKQTPTDMPEVRVAGGAINIVQLVVSAGFAKSTSEARRLVGQKAVSIDEQPVTEIDAEVAPTTGQVLRVGKRRFGRIVLP